MPTPFDPTTGDSNHCWLCGVLRVEANLASIGEPACRVCGCRKVTAVTPEILEKTKQQIRSYVGELQQLAVGKGVSREEFIRALVSTSCTCLAAYGGMFWRNAKKRWWWQRSAPDLEFAIGSPYFNDALNSRYLKFAAKISSDKQPLLEHPHAEHEPLLVGAPLLNGKRMLGGLVILQRPDSSRVTQRGYLRFLQQISEFSSQAIALQ